MARQEPPPPYILGFTVSHSTYHSYTAVHTAASPLPPDLLYVDRFQNPPCLVFHLKLSFDGSRDAAETSGYSDDHSPSPFAGFQSSCYSTLERCGCCTYRCTDRQHLVGPGQLTWKRNLVYLDEKGLRQVSRSRCLPVSYFPDFVVENFNALVQMTDVQQRMIDRRWNYLVRELAF